MKIAIRGHESRGKEVIQILESLGGKSREELTGRRISHYYFINCNGDIDLNLRINLFNRKLYTLEEFEKEFPFKVGDKVITTDGTIGVIDRINLKDTHSYVIKTDVGDFYWCETSILKLYKEMKEERNITLTLDKAKEWYKKGGELREIVLQAFSEKELTKVELLPKTWEEFCKNYPVQNGECWLSGSDTIRQALCCGKRTYINWIPSKQSAEAHLAMIQLEQLRDCWRQGWKPDLNDDQQTKYCVICYHEEFKINILYSTSRFLSFPTHEMAKEFLECFRDLIEKAGDLI